MPFARRAVAQKEGTAPPVGDDFQMDVVTASPSETFNLLSSDNGVFDAVVDWGDGQQSNITTFDDADRAHVYANAGTHRIVISGTFPNFYYNNSAEADKIKEIITFGNIGLITMNRAFYGSANMTGLNTLGGSVLALASMYRAFQSCNGLSNVVAFDTSIATTFYSAFRDCSDVLTFPMFDTGNSTSFLDCLRACFDLLAVPEWDYSKSTTFSGFCRANSSMVSCAAGLFDLSPATNYSLAFNGCALDQQSVDNILVSVDTAGKSNGTLGIDGGTSSAPGAAGLTAKTNLEARGWTVLTN